MFSAETEMRQKVGPQVSFRKGKRMTATQVLLTAAMGVVVGVIGGFDIGHALGFDAGSRRKAGEGGVA